MNGYELRVCSQCGRENVRQVRVEPWHDMRCSVCGSEVYEFYELIPIPRFGRETYAEKLLEVTPPGRTREALAGHLQWDRALGEGRH